MSWDEAFKKAKAIVVHGNAINKSFEEEKAKGAGPEDEDRQLV